MTSRDLGLLQSELSRLRALEECILWDFRSLSFGYGIDLRFDYIWNEDGTICENAGDGSCLVTLTLLGVESIQLDGGLTESMRVHPEAIGWGFGEVAQVVAYEPTRGLGLEIRWEGVRRLRIEFTTFKVSYPRR